MTSNAIGLIGGSFDPVHLGHLHLASEVKLTCRLSEVRFIPCHQNPLKLQPPRASAVDRVHMLKLAIAPFKNFMIDVREIDRKQPSYTIDTLSEIRKERPLTPLSFIMASDTFSQLIAWKDWKNLMHYAHLIIADRPGDATQPFKPELSAFLAEKQCDNIELLHQKPAGLIYIQKITPQPPISSTEIRQFVAQKKKISQWVPNSVENYILTQQLYTE